MREPSPQLLRELSELRRGLDAPKLSPAVFPRDLSVIDFDPDGRFRIRAAGTGSHVGAGLFGIVWFALAGTMLAGPAGLLVGLALGAWRASLGVHVSIQLARRSHALVTPGSCEWSSGAPAVEIRVVPKRGRWRTTLLIGGLPVIERLATSDRADRDLERFAAALNARLGRSVPVEIADGVFVVPDGR